MFTIPGRIPITVHPMFWLLAALIGWASSQSLIGTGIWIAIIFFSVLIHEFGHALTALIFGQNAQIELMAMGGVTVRNGTRIKPWQDFIVVFNGPLAGFLLFLLAYKLEGPILHSSVSPVIKYAVSITMYANLFWTVINLLPVYPLDGGRLFSIFMQSIFGMRGLRISYMISCIVAVVIGFYFFYLQSLLAGAIFMMLAFESYRTWKSSQIMTEKDQDSTFQDLLKKAEALQNAGKMEAAKDLYKQIRETTQYGVIYITATENLAAILSAEDNYKEAFDLLAPIQNVLDADASRLMHQLAYLSGHWKEAVSVGRRVYQDYPNFETALTNAMSYALLQEDQPAVGWLERSIADGLENPKVILQKHEFDAIRNSPLFRSLEERYA